MTAPALQQSNQAGSSTVTFTNAQTAGNCNIAIVTWDDNTSAARSNPTDTKGNVYSSVLFTQLSCGDGNSASIQVFVAPNIKTAAANGNAIDVSGTPPSGFELFIAEISGVLTTSPYDSASGASSAGPSGNASTTTGILSSSSEILIAACPSPNGNATSAGTGWTLIGAVSGGGTGYEYQVVSSTTAVTAKMNVSGDWVIAVVGFQAPGGGGGGPVYTSLRAVLRPRAI